MSASEWVFGLLMEILRRAAVRFGIPAGVGLVIGLAIGWWI